MNEVASRHVGSCTSRVRMWYQIGRKMRPRAEPACAIHFHAALAATASTHESVLHVLKVGSQRTMSLRNFSPRKQFHI